MIRTCGILNGLLIVGSSLVLEAADAPQTSSSGHRVKGLVRAIKVLPDKAPDCTSLKAIVDSITRGCRTNDEKAIAVYNFMQLSHYHRAYPEGGPVLRDGRPWSEFAYDQDGKRIVVKSGGDPRLHLFETVRREQGIDLAGTKGVKVEEIRVVDTLKAGAAPPSRD